ncbi:MAG: hypothetical protein WCK86_21510, partial [Planctomycetia bacterium]
NCRQYQFALDPKHTPLFQLPAEWRLDANPSLQDKPHGCGLDFTVHGIGEKSLRLIPSIDRETVPTG